MSARGRCPRWYTLSTQAYPDGDQWNITTESRFMTTQGTIAHPQTKDYSRLERLPDPPREPDMQQDELVYYFYGTLRPHFASRDDILIAGAGYLRREAGEAGELAPDCVFASGVANPRGVIRRNGYVMSEVGKPPDFVLEVGSRSTGRRDYTVKRDGYAAYGVREYWRFDPSGGSYHDVALAGDVLVDGEYVAVPITSELDGRHWGYSEVLGLELWWDNELLRFRDPLTGEFLPIPEELAAARRAADERADAERAARQDAEARLAEMEEELRRLRGE